MTALRELHRIIDQRVAQWQADHATRQVRGLVTAVDPSTHRLSARLDLAAVSTPGIAVPAGMWAVVGDDVVVTVRADGYRVCSAILGRAGDISGATSSDEPPPAGAALDLWLDLGEEGAIGAYTIGTSFPPYPGPYEQCFRTDIRGGMMFRWSGTYWLSESGYQISMHVNAATASGYYDSAMSSAHSVHGTLPLDLDVFLTTASLTIFVATTNNGSNYWTDQLRAVRWDNAQDNVGSALSTAAVASDGWRSLMNGNLNVLLDTTGTAAANVHALIPLLTKVGSPGAYYGKLSIAHRLRAT